VIGVQTKAMVADRLTRVRKLAGSRCLLSALLAAALSSASAQVPPPPRALPQLTRAEIKECLLRGDELSARHKAMELARAQHVATGRRLDEEARELDEMLKTLDRTSAAAVNLYNARNDARNAAVARLNQRADELDAAGATLRTEHMRHVRNCVARPSSRADREAVRAELGMPPELPASPASSTKLR
jgi:hypothetical protein